MLREGILANMHSDYIILYRWHKYQPTLPETVGRS